MFLSPNGWLCNPGDTFVVRADDWIPFTQTGSHRGSLLGCTSPATLASVRHRCLGRPARGGLVTSQALSPALMQLAPFVVVCHRLP